MDSIKRIQSYVYHGDKCFFVSTMERDSSAMVSPPPRYNETMVWVWDEETRERQGHFIYMTGDTLSLDGHFDMCRQLLKTGAYIDPRDVDDE
ncbi:MAG: hypothetical protein ACRBC3_19805 [Burkholderiaceae bacterium]